MSNATNVGAMGVCFGIPRKVSEYTDIECDYWYDDDCDYEQEDLMDDTTELRRSGQEGWEDLYGRWGYQRCMGFQGLGIGVVGGSGARVGGSTDGVKGCIDRAHAAWNEYMLGGIMGGNAMSDAIFTAFGAGPGNC